MGHRFRYPGQRRTLPLRPSGGVAVYLVDAGMDGTHRQHPRPAKVASGGMWMRAISRLACARAIRLSPDDDRPRRTLVADSSVFNGVHRLGNHAACHDSGNGDWRNASDKIWHTASRLICQSLSTSAPNVVQKTLSSKVPVTNFPRNGAVDLGPSYFCQSTHERF